jgi:hypothetical protein
MIEVDCWTCAGTGNMTLGGGRNNLKDRCTTCGGKGKMPARTGESAATSWPLAVPGAGTREQDEPTICVCGEPICDGDKVYTCESSGILHAACLGPEPECFISADGRPLKPSDPIPEPWVYSTREGGR